MLLLRGEFKTLFRLHYAWVLFVCIFGIPTTWSVFENTYASGRYVSEAQFIVRGVTGNQIGALSSLLKTFGISRSSDDSYAVESFIVSRDALQKLNSTIDIAAVYSRSEADILTRYYSYFSEPTFESLFRYYKNQVQVVRSFETGITTLRVSAYRPEDAKKISEALLTLSEARVNEMNERSRADLMRLAEAGLMEAEQRFISSQLDLTRFRNSGLNIDLEKAAAGRVELISGLYKKLAAEEVRLQNLTEISPNSPEIRSQGQIVAALRKQAETEREKMAGSEDAIASKLGQYERLTLNKTMSENMYEFAVRSLDQARAEARRKQIYLEPIVPPNLPDVTTEPRRIRRVFTTALLSIASFLMIYLLVSGSREHLNFH